MSSALGSLSVSQLSILPVEYGCCYVNLYGIRMCWLTWQA